MDLRDVITVSPLGITKTFDLASRKLAETGLSLEKNCLLSWDPSKANRIISASPGKIACISSVDGSSKIIKCPSYETDLSMTIGLSVGTSHLVVGRASGMATIVNMSDFSLYAELPVENNLTVCKSYDSTMVTGGKEATFSVWDLNNPKAPLFTAKNVRPDTLELKVPTWLSDISYVDGYEDRLFVTASKYGDFCVYDVRSGQRRPVSRSAWRLSTKQGKKSIGTGHNPAMLRDLAITRPVTRCVAFTSGPGSGLRTVAANAIGDICLLDFRVPHTSLTSGDADSNSKMTSKSVGSRAAVPPKKVQTFVPAAGAVSGLMCGGAGCANSSHVSINAGINDQPVVIASSLDRFFRVYNRDSGELLAKIFTKTPISTFLVRDSAEFPMDTVAEEKEDVNEEVLIQPSVDELDEKESDEIWSKMQTVVTKTVKRGHLATEGEKVPADEDKSGGRQSKKKKKHTKPQ